MGETLWCVIEMVAGIPSVELFRTKDLAINHFESILHEIDDYEFKTFAEVLEASGEDAGSWEEIAYDNLTICKLMVNEN